MFDQEIKLPDDHSVKKEEKCEVGFEVLELNFILDEETRPHLIDVIRDTNFSHSSFESSFFDKLCEDVMRYSQIIRLTVDNFYGFKESAQSLTDRTKFDLIYKRMIETNHD